MEFFNKNQSIFLRYEFLRNFYSPTREKRTLRFLWRHTQRFFLSIRIIFLAKRSGKRIYTVQYRLHGWTTALTQMRSRFEGLLTRSALLLFTPPFIPVSLTTRIRSRANEDLMETAPVPRLTDLKGTLNYLAANAVIYVVVGCLSNTEHRLVTRNPQKGVEAYAHCLPRFIYLHLLLFVALSRLLNLDKLVHLHSIQYFQMLFVISTGDFILLYFLFF